MKSLSRNIWKKLGLKKNTILLLVKTSKTKDCKNAKRLLKSSLKIIEMMLLILLFLKSMKAKSKKLNQLRTTKKIKKKMINKLVLLTKRFTWVKTLMWLNLLTLDLTLWSVPYLLKPFLKNSDVKISMILFKKSLVSRVYLFPNQFPTNNSKDMAGLLLKVMNNVTMLLKDSKAIA